jgi:ferric-dicitrate binding protein FerR (iron transport regulator)
MDQVETYRKVDTDKAWNQVHQRLYNDGLLEDRLYEKKLTANHRLRRWTAYAAALLLIIAAGGLGYFVSDLRAPALVTLGTGADDNVLIRTFADGSIVYLAGNSVLHYPEQFTGRPEKISFAGEAFFDIYHSAGKPFVIETKTAVLEVLGTSFNLRSSGEDLELIVEEGLVRITLSDHPEKSLIAGEWERVRLTGNSIDKSPVTDRSYLAWRMERMQFRDEKLENIAAVISRNYNLDIIFSNEQLKSNRLTVTFHNNDIKTIAEVIALSFNLEYEILPDSTIIFREKDN